MAAKEKKESFEGHLKQVEEVVKALEGGNLGLEESIQKYEAGIKALRHCYSILEEAEKKIQVLVKDKDGGLGAEDFDDEDGSSGKSGRKKRE